MKYCKQLLLLLLVCVLFCGQFSITASAGDNNNLIDSDLTNWTIMENMGNVDVSYANGLYRLYFTRITPDGSDLGYRFGTIYDLSDLNAGNSYTLSFFLPSYNQINDVSNGQIILTENSYYTPFKNYGGVLSVGLVDMSTETMFEEFSFVITGDNYNDYFGKINKLTFEMPSVKNPGIAITYVDVAQSGNNYSLWFSDFKLVDNDAEKELSFFDNLFQFFHDLKWDVTGGTCDKEDCLKKEHTSLAGRINTHVDSFKDSFDDKITKLKEAVEGLKDDIVSGIKSLFVPDEQFMENYSNRWKDLIHTRLGAVAQASGFLKDFFDSIVLYSGTEQNIITVPAVTLPLPDNASFTFGGFNVEIVNEKFVFLQDSLKVLVGFLSTIAFIYGLRKRYDEVMGVEQ